MRYSGFRVIKEALTGHKGWKPIWRNPDPQPSYDYIIVGGGGHGLATAYYLARTFKQARIAVLEKSWLGSGNIGRNTTIIRSNYLLPGNEPFYEFSMKLWEGLEQEFNFNAMVSQRGILNLIHSDGQRDAYRRRGNAMLLAGADAELLDREGVVAVDPDELVIGWNPAAVRLLGIPADRAIGRSLPEAVRHPATACPTVFDHALRPVGEVDDADGIVFALRLVAVNVGAHVAQDALDRGPAEEPPAKRDSMAAHIH